MSCHCGRLAWLRDYPAKKVADLRHGLNGDLAPKFYPILSSP
jgi:hypothetical protein